jgi:hypothetical protein
MFLVHPASFLTSTFAQFVASAMIPAVLVAGHRVTGRLLHVAQSQTPGAEKT